MTDKLCYYVGIIGVTPASEPIRFLFPVRTIEEGQALADNWVQNPRKILEGYNYRLDERDVLIKIGLFFRSKEAAISDNLEEHEIVPSGFKDVPFMLTYHYLEGFPFPMRRQPWWLTRLPPEASKPSAPGPTPD